MNLSRISLSVVLILACIAVVPAQEQCKLNIAESPTLRGLHLGMSMEQVRAKFLGLQIQDSGKFGTASASLNKSDSTEATKLAFDGANFVSLSFLDNRLTGIVVIYDGSVYWDSIDQFVAKISGGLRLPNAWQQGNQEGSRKLTCNGFELSVYLSSESHTGGQVNIHDIGSRDIVQKRIREEQEKQRQAFKP